MTGMPGISLTSPSRSTSDGSKCDARHVVANSRSLVLSDIRRYKIYVAFDFGGRSHIERSKPQGGCLAKIQLIDILRGNLDFDDERIRIGHNQHDRIASGNDPADGMNR